MLLRCRHHGVVHVFEVKKLQVVPMGQTPVPSRHITSCCKHCSCQQKECLVSSVRLQRTHVPVSL